jgi:ABC-2 type transport system permease protein
VIRAYRALLVAGFQHAAQYRVSLFLYVFFSLLRPIVFLAAWVAIVGARGGSIGSLGVPDFAAYYIGVTIVVHLTTSWNAYEFEFQIRQGRLSPLLLRPLHPIHYAVVENIVWKVFTVGALTPAIVAIALTFGARFPPDAWHYVLFVPSLLLAAALRFVFGWVVSASAFWITRMSALNTFSERIAFIFSGQIAPLALLPGPLQAVAYGLPYAYMLGVPVDILRGATTLEQSLLLMGGQALWLATAYAVLQVVWRAGLRQYSAVGA